MRVDGLVKREIIIRYSYSGVSVNVSSYVEICVEDKCAKLEKSRAKLLFGRVLRSIEGEEGEEIEKVEKEASLFEGEGEGEGEMGGESFYQIA